MADQKLKVVFKRVYVLDDSDWIGSGEFYFKVTVAGAAVGDPKRTFDAVEKTWINLPEAQWSTVVNVTGKDKVEVRFQGMDADLISDDDLGTVGFNLKPPWTQRVFRQATNFYIIEWQVELEVAGKFGMHPPDTVFACRENNGSVDCTTVSGTGITARLEIHPVRPVPTVGLPPRAPFPAGTGPPEQNREGTIVLPDEPMNVVTNPSVRPMLSEPDPAPACGAAGRGRLVRRCRRPSPMPRRSSIPIISRMFWHLPTTTGGWSGRRAPRRALPAGRWRLSIPGPAQRPAARRMG